MKKFLFIVITAVVLFAGRDAFALKHTEVVAGYGSNYLEYTVCNTECDFRTLDEAFTAVEEAQSDGFDGYVWIGLEPKSEYTFSDHTFSVDVGFYFMDDSDYLFNGNGSTLKTSKTFYFEGYYSEAGGQDLTIKNTNFVYTGEFYNPMTINPETDYYPEAFLGFEGSENVNIQNISVTSSKKGGCMNNIPAAIDANYAAYNITNSVIKNFGMGIVSGSDYREEYSLTVDNCDLYDNFIGLAVNHVTGTISNSRIKSMLSTGYITIKDNNDFGDSKVMMFDERSFGENYEAMCNYASNNGIFVEAVDDNYNVALKKNMTVDFTKDKEINNFLSLFKDDTSLDGFTFTTSDGEVATINNNKITIKKTGNVTIIAKNETTNEQYTLNLRVTVPMTNPVTGRNSIFLTVGIIMILLGGFTIYKNVRREQ